MSNSVLMIPVFNLALAFVPVLMVVAILYKWSLDFGNALYAVSRMLVQLLLVGYFLAFIFETDSAWIVLSVLTVMVLVSSWIALRAVHTKRRTLYKKSLLAIALGGGTILTLITQGVLDLQPWYWPRYMIPLAGMIFSGAMNSVSLASERMNAEIERNVPFERARGIALKASLIPITNSLFGSHPITSSNASTTLSISALDITRGGRILMTLEPANRTMTPFSMSCWT